MAALPKSAVSPTVLANANRAANKLRKSLPITGRRAGKQVAFDPEAVLALLKLEEAVTHHLRAPRQSADDDEITPNDAAEILQMSRPSVMRLIEKGELHPRMVHSRHKLARSEVMALAERQTRERRKALAKLTEITDEYNF